MKSWLKNKIQELYPDVDFDVLVPPDEKLGDYSVNLAFVLAKKDKKNPSQVGAELIEQFSENKEFKKYFNKIELAGGFVNFFLDQEFLRGQISEILKEKDKYGSGKSKKVKINIEFVSANPTGPPTVGNARAAAFGDTLGNIFKKSGYDVTKEYYINDVGVQIRKLGESIELRIREEKGEKVEFPADLYQGEYIKDLAKKFLDNSDNLMQEVLKVMVKNAQRTMESMGVNFDKWFYESELHEKGEVISSLQRLKDLGKTEEKDGALWFKFGDDKEAVLVKTDGATTYLMNDIAYSMNKFEKRKFDKAINIWGTDHHGDVERLLAGVAVLGHKDKLEILLHQLVLLKKQDEKLKISKRAGNLVMLDELIGDVGKDAVRFFFLTKDLNTHMEFDVDLAKEQSKRNPVYYIQYAYARLNQIFEKAEKDFLKADLNLLKEPEELGLIRKMVKFPELIEEISGNYQVHRLGQYAFELASDFHNFYEKHRVVQDDKNLEKSRLVLCLAVQTVLKLSLDLMGVSSPQKM